MVGAAMVAPAVGTVGYDRVGYPFTPNYGTTIYDDVSGPGLYSMLDVSIARGRADRWANIIAGECVLSLHDKGDGRYNPNNPASPLYGLLLPMVPCKITAVRESDSVEVDVFNGWLDEHQDQPDIETQQATFNFKDLLMWLDADNPVIAPTGPIYVGDAIGLILDWFSWTNPALRNLAKGSLLPNFVADGTKSGLALIGEMLTVDLGLFFHSRANVATYYDRYEYSRRASIGTFASAQQMIQGVARKNIKNRIVVTYTGGVAGAQTIEDGNSRSAYGPLAWPPVQSAYFGGDAVANSFGTYKVAQGANPINTMWSLRVSEGPALDFDKIMQADLIDRVTIQNPNAKDYHIEKSTIKASAGVLASADWVLSERPANLPALVGTAKVAPLVTSPGYDRVTY